MDFSMAQVLVPSVMVGVALLWGRRRWAAPTAACSQVALPDFPRLVLEGQGPEALLESLSAALPVAFGLQEAWVAEVSSSGLRRVASVGVWDGGEELAERAVSEGRTSYDEGGLVAVPLLTAGAAVAVIVVRRPAADGLTRLEDAAPHIAAAVRFAADRRRLRLFEAAVESAAGPAFITDRDGRIEWTNPAFTWLTGYAPEEVVGRTPRVLRSGAQPGSFYRDMWTRILAGENWSGELVERRKDGSFYTVEQTITPVRGDDGAISHFVVVHDDVTEKKRAEERIRYLSNYDTLTALPNRLLFRDRLRQAMEQADASGTRLAVLFVDLEHFSRVNDALGHDIGDRLLTTIVERLSTVAASADTIARVGGDEFAIVQTGIVHDDDAADLARRVAAEVVRPCDIDGHQVYIGASVGVALYPGDGVDADQLVKNADIAMYRAMREAPNGYAFFSAEIDAEVRDRRSLERDLRLALGLSQFMLHYQPQFDAKTGEIVGLEALLRWYHPENGLVPPGRFIPVAEQTGQIASIGEWVIREAVRQMRAWRDAGVPLVPVSVNLSAAQLRQPGLAEKISAVLGEAGIEPGLLELELTESMVMEDGEATVAVLSQLNSRGIRLSIDDFGTGYSSLNYLKRFPVHKLKIDQSFVRELSNSPHDAEIAKAIITLGHTLGLQVVSEGVETPSQLEYLRREGCDSVQGFLFSRPVPADQAAELLKVGRLPQPAYSSSVTSTTSPS